MSLKHLVSCLLAAALFATAPWAANAQTEVISGQGVGMDTQLVFPHTSLPGATGIDFSFFGGFAPVYPDTETHAVVIDFEWGPTATGPWTVSPDNVNTVPGGKTDFYSTGVFHGPEDAAFVALHFYAGGLMFVSGEFTHTSITPEPSTQLLLMLGVLPVGLVVRARLRRQKMQRVAQRCTAIASTRRMN